MRRRRMVPRFAGLLVLSLGTGVLFAGLLLPIVGAVGLAARSETNYFVNQSTALCTPPLAQTSKIVDAHGHVIAHFYGSENRRIVKLSQVPQIMQDSLLAVEDVRFYEDNGIDFKAALRALFANGSSGSVQQGGSTLTQQYVKNVLEACHVRGADSDTLSRKVREAAIALNLARTTSKSDILQGYLNLVYFGDKAYGIGAAAEHYFDEPVQRLNLPQSALLAGLVQAPSAYDPVVHPKLALERRNVVLSQLLKYDFINQQQYNTAASKPLGLHVHQLGDGCETSAYPWFCDYVDRVLVSQIGQSELLKGGLTVHTTLQPRMEKAAEAALRHYVPADNHVGVQGDEVLIQPETGDIEAIAQSNEYGLKKHNQQNEVDYAVDSPLGGGDSRGPVGSTFKMFVLAAALKEGLPLDTTIEAPPALTVTGYTNCDGAPESDYTVHNAGADESGKFNLVTGTWDSVNTFYAQLEQRVGTCEVARIARSLGVKQGNGNPLKQLSEMVLGEQTHGLSALDMAGAYAAIANQGRFCPPVAVTSITDADGKDVPLPSHQCTQVLDPQLAQTMTSIFEGVLTQPGATAADVGDPGRIAAAKTGTADNNAVSAFAGYVPQLAGFVWVGHPLTPGRTLDGVTLDGTYYPEVFGATIAGPIWKQTFEQALMGSPVEAMPAQPSRVYVRGNQIPIPDVAGDSPGDAVATLSGKGFDPTVSGVRVPSNLPAGVVAKTSPPAGSKATPGAPIVIYLSNGQSPKQGKSPPSHPTTTAPSTSHPATTSPPAHSTTPSTPTTTPIPPPAHSPPPTSPATTQAPARKRNHAR